MAYNEADSLPAVADEILSSLAGLNGHPVTELLIIDDGSNDGTGALADQLARERTGVRVLHHPANLGLGEVYRTGLTAARGRLVSFFPADGQFPTSILPEFFESAGSNDLVLGYLRQRKGTPVATLLSALERGLYRVLLGRIPRFQGVFMLRREVLERIPLLSQGRGWGIIMEMVLKVSRANHRVLSRPTAYRPRLAGHSKVTNAATALANLRQLLALRRLLS